MTIRSLPESKEMRGRKTRANGQGFLVSGKWGREGGNPRGDERKSCSPCGEGQGGDATYAPTEDF